MRRWAAGLSLIVGLLIAGGCAATKPKPPQVLAFSSQNVIALDAMDVVRIMRQAGFHDELILKLGPSLRNTLATSGGARLFINNKVEAAFAADHDRIYVSSRRSGSFIYNPQTDQPIPAVASSGQTSSQEP